MNAKLENNVQISVPSLRHLIDSNGNEWFCDAKVNDNEPLEGQACTPAEDWIYDRSFGG